MFLKHLKRIVTLHGYLRIPISISLYFQPHKNAKSNTHCKLGNFDLKVYLQVPGYRLFLLSGSSSPTELQKENTPNREYVNRLGRGVRTVCLLNLKAWETKGAETLLRLACVLKDSIQGRGMHRNIKLGERIYLYNSKGMNINALSVRKRHAASDIWDLAWHFQSGLGIF